MLAFLLPMVALAAEPASPEVKRPVGLDLGLALGRGGGFTAKAHGNLPIALELAANFGAAGSTGGPTTWIASGHLDLLFTPLTVHIDPGVVHVYSGFGATLSTQWTEGASDGLRGWRVPVGVELRFPERPVAVFAEYAWALPRPEESGGRVGIRWTF